MTLSKNDFVLPSVSCGALDTAMKCTIVTPSYNQGKYILDCLESVRKQTYRPIEHIIVDNSSTDETREILEGYQGNPKGIEVRLVIGRDKGQSDALNKGFEVATGDVVGWLNADDYYLPESITNIIKAFQGQHSDADIVYGNFYFVDEKGNIQKERKEIEFNFNIMLYYGCYIPTTSTFFRRKIFDNGCYLDADYHYLMDTEYFLRLHLLGYKFGHVSDFIACFRLHNENKSLHLAGRKKERFDLQDKYGCKLVNDSRFRLVFYRVTEKAYFMKRVITKMVRGCYF